MPEPPSTLPPFVTLLREHQPSAYAHALSILKDIHLAHDAVQEAFVAAYFSLHTLSNPEAFPAWLRTIVHHQCHRILRPAALHWMNLDAAPAVFNSMPDPHVLAEQSEALATLHSLLATLP